MHARVITARNVNEAFVSGLYHLRTSGKEEPTRNGPAIVAPGPVITEYLNPTERILWNAKRNANPVFHLMEALWMLAGDNKVAWLEQFNARMRQYAELDGHIHGAYGHRWRSAFGYDQILRTVDLLKADPTTRQAVISMWSPADLWYSKPLKDRPCNTHIYFRGHDGELDMTVCCRSNDMLWGAYGANAVHFSVLQEVIAHGAGLKVGSYYQMSNNFHLYKEHAGWLDNVVDDTDEYRHSAQPYPLFQPGETVEQFLAGCRKFILDGVDGFDCEFFYRVALPLKESYLSRKAGRMYEVGTIADSDWKLAYKQWLERRINK